jgi:hypothetical protein
LPGTYTQIVGTALAGKGGISKMTLTLFLAICILGCDLLIFFLFQWTLGERRRTRRRRNAKTRLASGLETDLIHVSAHPEKSARANAVPQGACSPKVRPSPLRRTVPLCPGNELSAYRRKALALASPRSNAKLAV